ncbi:hypothetical protein ACS0TY_031821 [Phlomoides rotata]
MEENDADDSSPAESYMVGFLIVNVVGLRYYQGTISNRELVGLVHEELNPYDGNAIRVLNMMSVQVGHIERSAAAVLSPLLDAGLITIEVGSCLRVACVENLTGIVPKPMRKGNRFKIPCQVHIFARIEEFERVKSEITRGGMQLISENSSAFTLSEAAAVKEKKSVRKEKSVDEIFKLLDLKVGKEGVLEALEPPKDLIKSKLFLYQKEGLGWLVSRENSSELPPFWEEKNGDYVNALTIYQTGTRPEPLRGGIFADDMGLGKTLTLLSLIAFDKSVHVVHSSSNTADEDNENLAEEYNVAYGKKSKSGKGSRKVDRSGKKRKAEDPLSNRNGKRQALDDFSSLEQKTTLIVCPPSVFSSWIMQLEEHTIKGTFKVYMYYGERTKDAKELRKHGIVLTTYSTLASEESWDDSPIKNIEWRRVILDEAHVIKNSNTQQCHAVTNLNAKRRWAFNPLSMKSLRNSLIQRSLVQGDRNGISRLQVLMATISLRRTKESGVIDLPSKSVETFSVDLSDEERRIYEQMEEEAKKIVNGYISDENVVKKNYFTVLSILVRLGQICTDSALCPADIKSLFPSSKIEVVL